MSRTLNRLDGSRQTRILTSFLLEHMTITIRSFPRGLFGTSSKLHGQFIKDTRPLDACISSLPLLERHSICIFCSPWSKVISLIMCKYIRTVNYLLIGATSYEDLHTVNG